jgi:hypothetical protein
VHGVATLQLSLHSVVPPSIQHTTTQNPEDIHVVYEFPYVFPEDLSGMVPISRRPYKMTPQGVNRVESAIEGTFGQGLHLVEFFALGLSSPVYKEERSIIKAMC